MPHIIAREYKKIKTPAQRDGIEFLWFAEPLANASETLVCAKHENIYFLLTIKRKNGNFIIKSDKTTRPTPSTIVKKALKSFCSLAECDVIYSNIANIKDRHLEEGSRFLKDIWFFAQNFPKDKEVWIEIGFGSGRHLLHQARQNPDILFIGLEIHKPSIEQVLKQIKIQKLDNLYVIDYDARLFLEFVPSNLVGKIFVHFPVPWDKKPHRRVFSKRFIKEAKRVLKKNGILELRTDSRNYFDYAMELFMDEPRIHLEVLKNIETVVRSKYEDRWRRMEKDIYEIRMINDEVSESLILKGSFDFEGGLNVRNIIKNFSNRPIKYDEYFIHFEKLYKISEDSILIKLSFGAFDRPEHLYIIIDAKGAKYFPRNPVLSRLNLKAHNKIKEMLYGKQSNSSTRS
ncbi:tRNA (guanosine(46)-N7)-methyltransferase TrmB [Nitrosophilus alvini]|uniref:tRNA (guanosine(46)-N7)-methyltransferase TrmB n=1 Tax=Nitrosophilus alvini TaxID=2714855 RepID=UPI00190D6B63|nr:tRNA (guanosine(46)-N7)-methyltransferase TrmB [Nitrosophilus alvini]